MSGSAFSTSVALQREHIKHEIAALHESIRQRKTRWNTLASISILPPEILAEIFIYASFQIEYCYDRSRAHTHARYRWIKVSQICKHWREIALASPSLWTGIVISSRMELISLLLERSKQAPLRIDIEDASNMKQACEVVLNETHRIQSLHICIPMSALRNLVDQIKGPLPLLETFTVIVYDSRQQILESLSAILQCHQTPRLCRLEISWHILRWNCLTSMTLKHLKVHCPSQMLLDPVDFFDTLEKLPLLESVDLGYLDEDLTPVTPLIRVITLPRLRSIEIMAPIHNCIDIFNHLSLPKLSTISMFCHGKGDGAALARSLADKMTSFEEPRTLRMDHSSRTITIAAYTIVTPDSRVHIQNAYPPATIYLSFDDRSWTNAILDILPLAGMCSAVFEGEVFDSKEEWLVVFERLQNLEVLHVDQDRGSDDLPEALRHRKSELNTGGEEQPEYTYPLPNLRMLRLSKVHFADSGTYKKGRLGKFGNALQDCLIERYEYGAEIQNLDLIRCKNLDWSGIHKLFEIIGYGLRWDRNISRTNYSHEEKEEEVKDEDEVEDEVEVEDEEVTEDEEEVADENEVADEDEEGEDEDENQM